MYFKEINYHNNTPNNIIVFTLCYLCIIIITKYSFFEMFRNKNGLDK